MTKKEYKSYDDLPVFISPKELAEILGIDLSNIYELLHQKTIPHVKIGSRYVIPKDDFLRWIKENKIA